MRVIGLDLSLTGTGIARFDGSTTTVKTRTEDGDLRLLHIQDAVHDALQPGIDLAVIEEPVSHGAYAIHTQGMVHGAVRAVLMRRDVSFVLVSVGTLKAYATGKGVGDKTAMAMAAYKRAGKEFPDNNQCDAWWLRLAGLDHYGQADVAMPETHRKRLDVVKGWPTDIDVTV